MTEYKGFIYKLKSGTEWILIWPNNSFRGKATAATEEELKAHIDILIAQAG